MKISIVFAVLVTSASLSIGKMNSVPMRFDILNPGFRVKTARFPNIESIKAKISVNHDGRVDGTWQYTVTLSPWTAADHEEWYAYELPNVNLKAGDKIYYQSEMITDIVFLNGSGQYAVTNNDIPGH